MILVLVSLSLVPVCFDPSISSTSVKASRPELIVSATTANLLLTTECLGLSIGKQCISHAQASLRFSVVRHPYSENKDEFTTGVFNRWLCFKNTLVNFKIKRNGEGQQGSTYCCLSEKSTT